MKRACNFVRTISDINERIKFCEDQKQHVIYYVHKLTLLYQKKQISYIDYYNRLNENLNSRTPKEWIEYYDHLIAKYKELILIKKHKQIKKKFFFIIFFSFIFLMTIFSFIYVNRAPHTSPFQNEEPGFFKSFYSKITGLSVEDIPSPETAGEQTEEELVSEEIPGEEEVVEVEDTSPLPEQPLPPLTETEEIKNGTEIIEEENITEEIKNETEIIEEENITTNITLENITTNQTTENITLQNISIENLTTDTTIETLTQGQAVLGMPVEWSKKIVLKENIEFLEINLPNLAENISVKKVKDAQEQDITKKASIKKQKTKNLITGEAIEEDNKSGILTQIYHSIIDFLKNLFSELSITGKAIDNSEPETNTVIEIQESLQIEDELIITYYTPAPYSQEEIINPNKKIINIIGPEEVHYQDILVKTDLVSPLSSLSKLKLYWLINSTRQEVIFNALDINNDSLYDRIEWTVPSLSNQTYELIIELTKAEHLDENKNFISDIYNETSAKDNIWSEPINANQFIRVSFEKNLTSERNIVFYARPNKANLYVEVYYYNSTQKISESPILAGEGTYTIPLLGLEGEQDSFDLKIVKKGKIGKGDFIEFDYIVDPVTYTWNGCVNGAGAPVDEFRVYSSWTALHTGTLICSMNLSDTTTNYCNCGSGSLIPGFNYTIEVCLDESGGTLGKFKDRQVEAWPATDRLVMVNFTNWAGTAIAYNTTYNITGFDTDTDDANTATTDMYAAFVLNPNLTMFMWDVSSNKIIIDLDNTAGSGNQWFVWKVQLGENATSSDSQVSYLSTDDESEIDKRSCKLNLTFYQNTSSQIQFNTCGNFTIPGGNYVLTSNINNAAGDCIVIKANNIVVDLNGYTIDGNDGTNVDGVFIEGYNGTIIKNGIFTDWYWGINALNVSNMTIFNNSFSSSANDGVRINLSVNSTFQKNRIFTSGDDPLDIEQSNYTIIRDNDINGAGTTGDLVFLNANCDYNTIYNNTLTGGRASIYYQTSGDYNNATWNRMWNCTQSAPTRACIVVTGGKWNVFKDNNANSSYGSAVLLDIASTAVSAGNNLFINENYTNAIRTTVNITREACGATCTNLNNTFINCSYNNESTSANSGLYRKWWYRAYANYSNGTAFAGVNITDRDSGSTIGFTQLTGSDGYITQDSVLEYYLTSTTKTFYNNHTVNATKTGYTTGAHSLNFTQLLNYVTDFFTFQIPATLSMVNLFPTTYTNFTQNQFNNVSFNITCSGATCGLTNISLYYKTNQTWIQEEGDAFEIGGVAGLTDADKINDTNWTSYGYGNVPSGAFFINYTKPYNSTGATWEVKDDLGQANLTIPQNCWDYDSTKLVLYALSIIITNDVQWYCTSNGGSNLLRGADNFGPNIYEEAIWWNEGGLVNTSSRTPVYTNTTNPNQTTLSLGQSQTITFWINSTGLPNTNYTIYAIAKNITDSTITNTTAEVNISIISATPSNTAPLINITNTNITADPSEAGSRQVEFFVNVTDDQGVGDITIVNASFSKTDETTRFNSTCININNLTTKTANYSCSISMWYWDRAGNWTINVTAVDLSNALSFNQSMNMTYNQLIALVISPDVLTFNVAIGTPNQTSTNDPTLINNTGNYNSTGKIQITALDLIGTTNTTQYIGAGNFTSSINTGSSAECSGTSLSNNSAITIANTLLEPGNNTAGNGQEQLYYCLLQASGISSQNYTTSLLGSWTIKLALALLIIPRTKKKKKTGNIELPIQIFSSELGALEAVSKYMKEDLGLRYSEIAKLLNRDQRTIYTAYTKAKIKMPESLSVKENEKTIPVQIFSESKLTILDSLIIYLKSQEKNYSEIARLLNRNPRNIRTSYINSVKRIKEEDKEKIKKSAYNIVLSIFSSNLGALEAVSKYMKEDLGLRYSEIAKLLNRDQRTIYTAYTKAKIKMPEELPIKTPTLSVPIFIFEDKNKTILESIIFYLRKNKLKYSEIAKLLKRDPRNIWNTYSKIIKEV